MSTATLVSGFHTDLYKGLQSHRVSTDLRQQMSLALERQLTGQLVNSYAASLMNLPFSTQGSSTLSALNSIPSFAAPAKTATKPHPPLTASNSVANCDAASHLKALTATREHRKLDRSISEPVTQQVLKPIPSNSSRYKTELCRPFEENGTCKYGDKCQFAHGIGELRTLTRHPKYKTELCRTFHSTGFCPYGPRCHFIHNSEDSKKCLLNTLQSSNTIPVAGQSPSKNSTVSKDLDICGFSIGSAGDLSPTSSTTGSTSSGSPTSINCFFMDDIHASSSLPQVPQTALPNLNGGAFFGSDYLPLKSLSRLQSLAQQEEYLSPEDIADDDMISQLDMLVSELDISGSLDGDTSSNASLLSSKPEASAAIDINRNSLLLPYFHTLSVGK